MTCRRDFSLHRCRTLLLAVIVFGFASLVSGADDAAVRWPFTSLSASAVPSVEQKSSVHNAIDAFIIRRLEQAKLKLNRPADRVTLLRRVTYDLTGMLPTSAERDAFLSDSRDDAYERVVDRLLRSPHFGERWAQHWLDLVRYAETEGFKVDRLRPNAFRYRDYVIRASNDDLPYDRFISQQVAGDELEPNNADARIATGFWRLHIEESNGADYSRIRQDILDDNTDVFGSAFLGLTVGCARCHNHKFDPISQKDYYGLQAFFVPMMQREDCAPLSAEEQARYEKQMVVWEKATQALRAESDRLMQAPAKEIFNELVSSFDLPTQTAMRLPAEQRTPLQKQLAALANKQVSLRQSRAYRRLSTENRARYDALQANIAQFDHLKPAPLPGIMSVADIGTEPPITQRLGGGSHLRPLEAMDPRFPKFLSSESPVIHVANTEPPSTGRRSALAAWLCRPDHPLTSRVIVNRLWQHYLGRGIVGTPNDFGAMGEAPTHPELLDYLACELVKHGWRLKEIHRLIVTSATYRQSSAAELNPSEALAVKCDPRNLLCWHMASRRRDAESLRDATLQVAGRLNERMYGPSVHPELPSPLNEYRSWVPEAKEEDRNRRSIYIMVKRNLPFPLLASFDTPDRLGSCAARTATTSAPQALALLNSDFTLAQAHSLAERLLKAHGADREALIREVEMIVYNRAPTPDESAAALQFLDRQMRLISPVPNQPRTGPQPHAFAAAFEDFCHALLNSSEFLLVD